MRGHVKNAKYTESCKKRFKTSKDVNSLNNSQLTNVMYTCDQDVAYFVAIRYGAKCLETVALGLVK